MAIINKAIIRISKKTTNNSKFIGSILNYSKQILALFVCCIFIFACNTEDVVYLKYKNLNGWDKNNVAEFDLSSVDKHATEFNIAMNIRIDGNYVYTTLPIIVEIESSTGLYKCDTIIFKTDSPENRKLSVGGLCNIARPIYNRVKLPHTCRITLSQISNKTYLPGVISIGLLVKRIH